MTLQLPSFLDVSLDKRVDIGNHGLVEKTA